MASTLHVVTDDHPMFVSRGSQGILLWQQDGTKITSKIISSSDSRALVWNPDGSQLTYCDGQSVQVCNVPLCHVEGQLDFPASRLMAYSPLGTYLLLWQPYVVRHGEAGQANLHIFQRGDLIAEYFQKRQDNWCPQWTDDEHLCARNVTNEVHFFEGGKPGPSPTCRLQHEHLMTYALSHGTPPYHVAIHIKGTKGAPSSVQLYMYPQVSGPGAVIANKSFYKADTVEMTWDKKGKGVLVLTATDVDKSGASYYGEQGLYYLSVKGEGFMVPLDKKGPIYGVEWSPTELQFCVVYGYPSVMPSKAALFNNKCEMVFDFGITHRNTALYNPHGNILCLAGFGNLRGNMEFWDTTSHKLISKAQASDSTTLGWSPDGAHVLTATTSPRLREGNGFKLWHFTGALIYEEVTPSRHELWEVSWRPCPCSHYPVPNIASPIIPIAMATTRPKAAIPVAYVPPSLRGQPRPVKQVDASTSETSHTESLSKSAMKNKKKREAQKRSKQEQSQTHSQTERGTESQREHQDVLATTSYLLKTADTSPGAGASDNDKRLKSLKKKLKQIESLKQQVAEGKVLEANQVEKIKAEQSIIDEIAQLEL